MPLRGAVFPEIAATEYRRQTELIQTRLEVPFGDPQINIPHPFSKELMWWNSTFLTPADLMTLRLWFKANSTTFFGIYDPPGWGVLPVDFTLVGTIVGGVMTYTLPGKELVSVSLWDNNSATLIAPANYAISAGTGAEGEDQATFGVGHLPTVGHSLYCSSASGRKKFNAWCISQKFPMSYTGDGDLFTLEQALEFEEKIT